MNDRAAPHIWDRLRRIAYYAAPVLLLDFLFARIDRAAFLTAWRTFRPPLLVAGLLCFPLTMVVCAWRWQWLLSCGVARPVPLGFAVRHSFVGLVAGLFAPGNVGWGVYRAELS